MFYQFPFLIYGLYVYKKSSQSKIQDSIHINIQKTKGVNIKNDIHS